MCNDELLDKTISLLNEGMMWGEDPQYDEQIGQKMNKWIEDFQNKMSAENWQVEQTSYDNFKLPIWKFKKDDKFFELNANFDKVGIMEIAKSNLDLNFIAREINADDTEYANEYGYIMLDSSWQLPSVFSVVNAINQADIMEVS